VGEHTYKIEIRSEGSEEHSKDITGTFTISENECKKIFLDYNQIFDIDCDQEVIISEELFGSAPWALLSIIDMEIVDDCLKIKFSASGCNGDTWIVRLITDGWLITTMPYQRDLRLSLENNEPCETIITKEISFDIKNLQIEGENEIGLCFHIHGLGTIRYYY
jgi:hypothetical protein